MKINLYDIINTQINELFVLSKDEDQIIKGRKRRYYWCLCSCGNTKSIIRDSLISKKIISCGCAISKARTKAAKERLKTKDPSQIIYLYTQTKGNAKYRNLEFNLEKDIFKKLILSNCHYCGTPPSNFCNPKNYYGSIYYNGLDRKDSSKGYTEENTVTSCYICNRAKMDLSYKEFKDYIKRLIKYNDR